MPPSSGSGRVSRSIRFRRSRKCVGAAAMTPAGVVPGVRCSISRRDLRLHPGRRRAGCRQPSPVHYEVGDNAGEAPAGKVGGLETYDYRFTLPVPFEVAPYTPYWIQIEALQTGEPDWGLVQATNGDSQHFRRRIIGSAANYFQMAPGDPAVELLAQGVFGEVPTPAVRRHGTGRSHSRRCPGRSRARQR